MTRQEMCRYSSVKRKTKAILRHPDFNHVRKSPFNPELAQIYFRCEDDPSGVIMVAVKPVSQISYAIASTTDNDNKDVN